MKEIWRNLDGPPKNKELWNLVDRKVAHKVVAQCLLFVFLKSAVG